MTHNQGQTTTEHSRPILLRFCGRTLSSILAALALVSWFACTSTAHSSEADEMAKTIGVLYRAGKYADAIPIAQRLLAIYEKVFGPEHPTVAPALNNLANLYDAQGRYADAEPLYKRALAIREQALGPDHPDVARSLNDQAGFYRTQGRYTDAEPLYKRAGDPGQSA